MKVVITGDKSFKDYETFMGAMTFVMPDWVKAGEKTEFVLAGGPKIRAYAQEYFNIKMRPVPYSVAVKELQSDEFDAMMYLGRYENELSKIARAKGLPVKIFKY